MILAQTGGVGLQPRSVVPFTQLSNAGAVTTVHVNVLVQVLVNPQPVAVYVNTWLLLQPVACTVPGVQMTGTDPHSL